MRKGQESGFFVCESRRPLMAQVNSTHEAPVAISAAILAGGQSSRMGQDKAFLPVGGQPVIQRVIEQLSRLCQDVLVVTNSPDAYRERLNAMRPVVTAQESHSELPRLRLVRDIYPGTKALGGIYTALDAARCHYCLIVACDMPFLNLALLRHMISLAPDFDAVIPCGPEGLEPLHAVYSKACLEPIARRLSAGQLRIRDFLDEVRVYTVTQGEITGIDPGFLSFFNMNTPADYEYAQQLATRS